MRASVASSLLIARLATATFYNGGKSGSGSFYEGAYGQNAGDTGDADFDTAPFESAAANPNATNSVSFNNFTWRTNVSEVSVDDATTPVVNGTAVLNARVISTVFDLSWPGNGTIGQALQSSNDTAPFGCFTLIDGLGLPENVTSKYNAADNASCTNVLGDDCVRDFLASNSSASLETYGGITCPGIPDIPASCAATLGTVNTSFNGYTGTLENIYGGKAAQNGQAFAHILTSAYNGTNATAALQEAESRLQILWIPGIDVLACQKVDSTLTVTSAPTPAGATPSSTTNAAAAVERMSYGVMGMGMLGAVFLGL